MSDFFRSGNVRARKPHTCRFCGTGIAVGDDHTRYVGVFEGDFLTWRMHPECQQAQNEAADLQGLGWDDELPDVCDLEPAEIEYLVERVPTFAARIDMGAAA